MTISRDKLDAQSSPSDPTNFLYNKAVENDRPSPSMHRPHPFPILLCISGPNALAKPPADSDPSPEPPPYDFVTDMTQPFNQQLLHPQLTYNTFPDDTDTGTSESESRSCGINYEALVAIFFVVVIGLILLSGLEGWGMGSRGWPWRADGPGY
ncbi:hypothetical protein BJY00DRAFT_286074 [Aspergillus carlsbadensis]|nr:hypothetical protein BJY00DRAFT_286074 [Aspergillus carlsbadensis]